MNAAALRFSHLTRAFRLVFAAGRGWTVAWAAALLFQGLLPVALVFLSKPVVDAMQAAVGGGASWEAVRPIALLGAAIVTVVVLMELMNVAVEWISTVQSELVQDHLSDLLHAKSTTVDFAFYETPDYYDRMFRARTDASSRPLAVLQSTGSLVQNGITLVAMGAILLPYGIWLPPALLLSTLPAFFVVLRTSRRYHDWWTKRTTDRRRTQYFGTVLTDAHYAGEMRFFGLGDHFRGAYRAMRTRLRAERLKLLKDQNVARLGAEFVALMVSAGAIGWAGWRALVGVGTLGDVALFYQAFKRGQGLLRALLASIGQIYNNGLFLANLFEFLDLQPRIVDSPKPRSIPLRLEQGIRFRDVTFKYPGTDRVALQEFNLTIPAGRTVAIVGANGAGKTTLLKLLCRFYDPEAGSVEFDGVDLRSVSLTDLRQMITVMFQLPVSYQDTARQNIGMGNLAQSQDQTAIETAARLAGAHDVITRLPSGYESLLGKWFAEGTELSAGEWQRVAMARAFLRQSGVIILDEPTSFMDSWAEAAWFEKFRELAHDRTAIIITHRLTIAMRADVIHVMDRGEIVESGSHQDLVAADGTYAKSWRTQVESG